MVISHGSREKEWVERVDRTVEEARSVLQRRLAGAGAAALNGEGTREKPEAVEVVGAYLELVEGRLIQDGVDRLEEAGATHVLAVPLFLSSGSTHVDEIGWALGAYPEPRRETDLERMRVGAKLTYGRPLANDAEVAEALADLAARVSESPAEESLLLIGHGSEEPWFREAWERDLSGLAVRIAERVGFADAAAAMLRPDQAAEQVGRLRERRPGARVVAVPAFVSEGYFTAQVIPARLAGLDCRYVPGSIIPHPRITDWIVRQAMEWLDGLEANRG
nr:CbiX/SirB N-terminal domain-containing protein [Cohnella algarum]